eukprot:1159420-Pelagomonas_calceolata.AAC.5
MQRLHFRKTWEPWDTPYTDQGGGATSVTEAYDPPYRIQTGQVTGRKKKGGHCTTALYGDIELTQPVQCMVYCFHYAAAEQLLPSGNVQPGAEKLHLSGTSRQCPQKSTTVQQPPTHRVKDDREALLRGAKAYLSIVLQCEKRWGRREKLKEQARGAHEESNLS